MGFLVYVIHFTTSNSIWGWIREGDDGLEDNQNEMKQYGAKPKQNF